MFGFIENCRHEENKYIFSKITTLYHATPACKGHHCAMCM